MLNLLHKKLETYQISMLVVNEIYLLTRKFPDSEKFALCIQLRRAAVSICSNIAEGCSRTSKADRKRFLEIARSSLVEVDCQLEIAILLNYLQISETEKITSLVTSLFRLLSRMIDQLKLP